MIQHYGRAKQFRSTTLTGAKQTAAVWMARLQENWLPLSSPVAVLGNSRNTTSLGHLYPASDLLACLMMSSAETYRSRRSSAASNEQEKAVIHLSHIMYRNHTSSHSFIHLLYCKMNECTRIPGWGPVPRGLLDLYLRTFCRTHCSFLAVEQAVRFVCS